jgi:hypothetical protein
MEKITSRKVRVTSHLKEKRPEFNLGPLITGTLPYCVPASATSTLSGH